MDGLFVGLCMHLSGHYKIISNRISALKDFYANQGADDQHLKCSGKENEKIEMAVLEIIHDHVELIKLTNRLSKIFSMIVFVHFLGSSIVIGMTSINFLLVIKEGD